MTRKCLKFNGFPRKSGGADPVDTADAWTTTYLNDRALGGWQWATRWDVG